MILCGTATMKILDLLFKLGYENIWEVGFKVGVIGWISSLAVPLIIEKNKEKNKKSHRVAYNVAVFCRMCRC